MKLKILVIATSLFMALSSTAYAEHHGTAMIVVRNGQRANILIISKNTKVELHEKLKLSANQEPAWKAFQTAIQPTDFKKPDFEALNKLNTLERLDRMQVFEKSVKSNMIRKH